MSLCSVYSSTTCLISQLGFAKEPVHSIFFDFERERERERAGEKQREREKVKERQRERERETSCSAMFSCLLAFW